MLVATGLSDRIVDLLKVYIDDDSYNNGHGHAYEALGIEANQGAMIVVRPDQYVSLVTSLDDYEGLQDFFERVLLKMKT